MKYFYLSIIGLFVIYLTIIYFFPILKKFRYNHDYLMFKRNFVRFKLNMKCGVLLLFFINPPLICSQNVEQNIDRRYDIVCEGNGVEGTYLVRVWVYANKHNLKPELIRKYAIHGVVFKGVTGSTKCNGQKPLAKSLSVEEENKVYFDEFFEKKNAYLNFATIIEGTFERVKVTKRQFKIGAVVSVSKDQLRKQLEADGIIRGLSTGF